MILTAGNLREETKTASDSFYREPVSYVAEYPTVDMSLELDQVEESGKDIILCGSSRGVLYRIKINKGYIPELIRGMI
jgi:hypothetical protein